MILTINGKNRDVTQSATVEALVLSLGLEAPEGGVAVALNGEVLRRGEWKNQTLKENDKIEIVRATQGG